MTDLQAYSLVALTLIIAGLLASVDIYGMYAWTPSSAWGAVVAFWLLGAFVALFFGTVFLIGFILSR